MLSREDVSGRTGNFRRDIVDTTSNKLRSAMPSLLAAVGLVALLAGCAGYVPGRQAYWDTRLKELCAEDGGVRIIERVVLSPRDVASLPRSDGMISIPSEATKDPSQSLYAKTARTTMLHEKNPSVRRDLKVVIRASDKRVVAEWVVYSRVGGDFPTGISHPSSFTCPEPRQLLEELQPLFVVKE
jgi:hypothetical protein